MSPSRVLEVALDELGERRLAGTLTPVVDGNVVVVSGLDRPVQALRVVASKGGGWRAERG